METVFQVITAAMTSVAVINGKELSPNSFLLDVESDADSVLIVISRYALVSIDCITLDHSIFL